MKKREILAVFTLIIIFSIFTASASLGDWIKGITGHATQQEQNVSVSLTGTNPVTIDIINSTLTGTVVDPTENSYTTIEFDIHISDPDGVEDINDSSVNANFTKTGEALRLNSTCPYQNDINTTTANFSCSIPMWYFDAPGTWTITAIGNDIGNLTAQIGEKTFNYDSLVAMILSPPSVSWTSVSPGQQNQTASDDPTLVNNTGNYNITNITFIGINLLGETTSTSFIGVGNISVDIDTGGDPPAECTSATALVNATEEQIESAELLRGNHTVNDGSTGQEQLYYCMTTVPLNLPSQTYSTTGGGAWTIRVVQ